MNGWHGEIAEVVIHDCDATQRREENRRVGEARNSSVRALRASASLRVPVKLAARAGFSSCGNKDGRECAARVVKCQF